MKGKALLKSSTSDYLVHLIFNKLNFDAAIKIKLAPVKLIPSDQDFSMAHCYHLHHPLHHHYIAQAMIVDFQKLTLQKKITNLTMLQ